MDYYKLREIKSVKACVLLASLFAIVPSLCAQKVDYSVVSVPEESGLEITKISNNSDFVCMPEVVRRGGNVAWFSNNVLAVIPQSDEMGYLSYRNGKTNVFIKDVTKQGSSKQRTNRNAVIDFSFSPDGKTLYFSENRGKGINQIFQTDAVNGYVCRQITTGAEDYSPKLSYDGKLIFFTRAENQGCSIWSFNIKDQFLSNYSAGQNPWPVKDDNAIIIARQSDGGRTELWRIKLDTGVEECIVSDPVKSYTSPSLSPDGQWLLFVGSSFIEAPGFTYPNTDIYVCRTDGTDFRQLTYHAADDLSPVWSNDGKFIYFVSQRGDAEGAANIWRMSFEK